MKNILLMYGISFGLTLLIELPVCYLLGLRSREELEVVFLVNLLTNPAAVWLHSTLGLPQIIIEVLVVIIECYVYRQFRQPHPLRLSLLANGISWGLGLLLQML
mgnify:CR=1 FL=1